MSAIESAATALGQGAQTVGEDLAQAGDHACGAETLQPLDSVLRQAVTAEQARGAG
ncbi:hypothetical protein ACH4ND_25185 [Streptomyces sp. NPDC017179]|uniref:hypothetical protein n=1 Tax=Streptomyces sp. NPDC017179 TaxID=3364979 RepID=UPI0037988495